MELKQRIEQINNPQLFTELVKALLLAEHGTSYQPIDDNRADNGNDGYIPSTQTMFARHCFKIPPTRQIDQGKFSKLSKDLRKAVKMKDEGRYNIATWICVTNYDVSESLYKQLFDIGAAAGITVTVMDATFLTNLLTKHPKVLSLFAQLSVPDLAKQLELGISEIKSLMTEATLKGEEVGVRRKGPNAIDPPFTAGEAPSVNSGLEERDPDYSLVLELTSVGATHEARVKLDAILNTSKSKNAQVQSILLRCSWFNPPEESDQELIDLIDIGISLCRQINDQVRLAALYAQKAYFTAGKMAVKQMQLYYELQIDRLVGHDPTSQPSLEAKRQELLKLDSDRRQFFITALDTVEITGNLECMAHILMMGGEMAGSLAVILKQLGDLEQGRAQLALSRKMFIHARNYYQAAGSAEGSVYAMYNHSNQLRSNGDNDAASAILDVVEAEATQLGMKDVLKKVPLLRERINSGIIPDYSSGSKT